MNGFAHVTSYRKTELPTHKPYFVMSTLSTLSKYEKNVYAEFENYRLSRNRHDLFMGPLRHTWNYGFGLLKVSLSYSNF